ncbi:MAG: SurA N-terminal domain-containing protein [Pseudomonadales bacterium]
MVIQKLQDGSQGIVAKIIVALIIVVFALFGFGSITTYLAPVPKVATVGGEDITREQLEIAMERERRILLSNGTAPADIDESELRDQALASIIDRQLLSRASEDLGLYVSEEKIDKQIVETPAFQVDGVFDVQQFQMAIGSAGYTPLMYRTEMKRDMKFQQLGMGIQSSAFFTMSEAERAASLANQTRDIAYLRISVDELMDEVNVTDKETRAYYDNHVSEFKTKETVNLAYLEVRRDDLMDDVEVSEAELRARYEETRQQYATDENRRVAHILIEADDEGDGEKAKERIDELYDRIKSGEDFAELAREYSDDPGPAEEGGDLGYSPPGTYTEPFEEVAYNLDVGELSAPVETEFGYHLIKLLDVEPEEVPSFEDIRDEVEQDLRQARAEELFVNQSSQLAEIAYESPDLGIPAEELGMAIKTTGHVSKDVSEGIAANDGVMEAAFSPDVLLDGNNSDVIEITPNHHVVVRVREHRPSEVKPYEEIAEQVRDKLAREKATLMAEANAKEIVEMLDSGSITRYVADKFGLQWQVVPEARRNHPDIDPEIRARAFNLARPPETGKSVGYTILEEGDAAVVTVTNVENGDVDAMAAQDIRQLGRALANQRGRHDFQEFRANLEREIEVTTR